MSRDHSDEDLLHKGWNALVAGLGREGALDFLERFAPSALPFLDIEDRRAYPGSSILPGSAPLRFDAHPSLGATRSTIDSNLREILKKNWVNTGFEMQVIPPAGRPWRIPLNYKTIQIGGPGIARRNDVEFDYSGIENVLCRLEFFSDKFFLVVERGEPILRNGQPIQEGFLEDGDVLVAGGVEMRIFKPLDIFCELTVISPGRQLGEKWILDRKEIYLGRPGHRYNDVELHDETVSRRHARLEFLDGRYYLFVESSITPTFVNGTEITAPTPLDDNDVLVMGSKSLCFRFEKKSAQAVCMNLRRLSILFADIRSFTAIAEDLPMKDMVSQLDEFFKAMGDIIGEHGGTVLRYMGDAILAIFGAPVEYEDHAKRAVLASIEMHMKIGALNEVWIARGQPLFRMGIGINTGEVMAGDMGSRHLREYSIVGDDANLAARLEELTKELDARIIISGSTKDEIGDAAVAVPLGTVTVEGRKKPTEIYRVDW